MKTGKANASVPGRGSVGWWVLGFALVLGGGSWLTAWTAGQADRELRSRLMFQAAAVARQVTATDVGRLGFEAADRETVCFQRLRQQLTAYAREILPRFGHETRYLGIYSMARRGDDIVFGPESIAEDHPFASPPGTVYHAPPEAVRQTFESGSAQAVGPYVDEYGRFVSAFAPVRDPRTGAVVLVIGLDLEAGEWHAAVVRQCREPLGFGLALLLVLIAWLWLRLQEARLPKPAREWYGRHGATVSVALAGLVLSLLLARTAVRAEAQQHRDTFRRLAAGQLDRANDWFVEFRDGGLASLSLFFESSEEVTRDEFEGYGRHLSIEPAVQAWAWIPVVPAGERLAFEASARQSGLEAYQIWEHDRAGARVPVARRSVYYPVVYAAPTPGNDLALGFDVGSEPARRAALDEAARTGESSATAPVTMLQRIDGEQATVVFHPVETAGSERRLRGFVAAVIRHRDLMDRLAGLAETEQRSLTSLELRRLSPAGEPEVLASTASGPPEECYGSLAGQRICLTVPLFAFGQTYALRARPTSAFASHYPARAGWLAGLAGLCLTALLTALVGLVRRRHLELEAEVRQRTAALRESRSQYRSLVETLPQSIFRKDRQGRFTFANAQFCRELGRPVAEILGRADRDFYPAELAARYEQDDRRVMEAGELLDHVEDAVGPDGEARYVQVVKVPLLDAEGRVEGVQGIFWDVTESRLAEEALRQRVELQDQLAKVATTVPGLICSFRQRPDGTTCVPFATAAIEDVYGLRWEDVKDDFAPALARLHPDDVARAVADIATSARTLEPWHDEYRVLHPERGERWVEGHSVPQREPDGSILWHGFVQDVTERKRAEEALAAEATRRRIFVEGSRDGIVVLNEHGGVVEANRRFAESLGYTVEEVTNLHVWDWNRDWPRERVLAAIRDLGPEGDQFESRHWRKDGSCFDVELSNSVAQLGGQRLVFCVCHDITERKQANEAVRRSEARLVEAQRLAEIGSWDWNTQTGEVIWSAEMYRLFGRDPALGAVGVESGHELFTPESWARLKADLEHSLSTGEPHQCDAEVVQPDGTHLWVTNRGQVLRDDRGTILGLSGTTQNITERKQAEEALRTREAQLSNALSMAHAGHWEYDVEADLFTFNDNFYRIFGTTAEEVGGYTMSAAEYAERFCHPDDRHRVAAETQAAIETADPDYSRQLEHRILDARGQVGHMAVRFSIVKDPQGRTIKTYGVNQDITEQKHAEETRSKLLAQLQHAQKMEAVGHLAGGVAHDFNNILAALTMQLELLQHDEEFPATAKDRLEELRPQVDRATALTRQLLLFARRGVMQRQVLDLQSLIANLLKMLGRLIGEHIRLSFQVGDAALWVDADPGMLEQVVTNLVVNARDAMPRGGLIDLDARLVDVDEPQVAANPEARLGRFVCLSVRDTGSGMDEHTRQRLFEPFFTTKAVGQGTGLGLATVQGIVNQHEGWIEVESELGQGSCFHVFLPLAAASVTADGGAEAAAPVPGGSETILLVEDEDAVRRLMVRVLERHGYHVLQAGHGQEALKLWNTEAESIDLLVTDMVMPEGLDGFELATQVRQRRAELPVIIMTGYSAEVMGRGLKLPPRTAFLQKPFAAPQILHTVRQLLDQATG